METSGTMLSTNMRLSPHLIVYMHMEGSQPQSAKKIKDRKVQANLWSMQIERALDWHCTEILAFSPSPMALTDPEEPVLTLEQIKHIWFYSVVLSLSPPQKFTQNTTTMSAHCQTQICLFPFRISWLATSLSICTLSLEVPFTSASPSLRTFPWSEEETALEKRWRSDRNSHLFPVS